MQRCAGCGGDLPSPSAAARDAWGPEAVAVQGSYGGAPMSVDDAGCTAVAGCSRPGTMAQRSGTSQWRQLLSDSFLQAARCGDVGRLLALRAAGASTAAADAQGRGALHLAAALATWPRGPVAARRGRLGGCAGCLGADTAALCALWGARRCLRVAEGGRGGGAARGAAVWRTGGVCPGHALVTTQCYCSVFGSTSVSAPYCSQRPEACRLPPLLLLLLLLLLSLSLSLYLLQSTRRRGRGGIMHFQSIQSTYIESHARASEKRHTSPAASSTQLEVQVQRSHVCMYVCKDSAAPAHQHTRVHAHTYRPAAPHQSSGVSQTPHPTACPQAGIPHRPP